MNLFIQDLIEIEKNRKHHQCACSSFTIK